MTFKEMVMENIFETIFVLLITTFMGFSVGVVIMVSNLNEMLFIMPLIGAIILALTKLLIVIYEE